MHYLIWHREIWKSDSDNLWVTQCKPNLGWSNIVHYQLQSVYIVKKHGQYNFQGKKASLAWIFFIIYNPSNNIVRVPPPLAQKCNHKMNFIFNPIAIHCSLETFLRDVTLNPGKRRWTTAWTCMDESRLQLIPLSNELPISYSEYLNFGIACICWSYCMLCIITWRT